MTARRTTWIVLAWGTFGPRTRMRMMTFFTCGPSERLVFAFAMPWACSATFPGVSEGAVG